MEPLTPDTLSTLGIGGILAGLMFYFYRKDVNTYIDQWRGATEMLVGVIKENTSKTTENTEVLRALHRRFDKLEDSGDSNISNQPSTPRS